MLGSSGAQKYGIYNGLWEHSVVTQIGWDGWVIPLRPLKLLGHMQC